MIISLPCSTPTICKSLPKSKQQNLENLRRKKIPPESGTRRGSCPIAAVFLQPSFSCSQRKARNLFKEDLLYSTGKKTDQSEEIDELQDQDQIIREIEDLQTEKSKLVLDINKCEQFINLKSSSAYFRFHYLLTKLQLIRKCTQLGSVSMLTADYFSMVLDKRKEMIEMVKSEMENVQKTMDRIQSLRQQFDNEITSFVSAMDQSEGGCRSIIRDAEQSDLAAFVDQLPSQQRLEMLDDKLAQIIRSFKEKVSRSVPKKSKEKEKVEVELNYDPAVTADDVVKASAENLNKFKENVGATMQRCFQHIEGRLLRMQASRRALMEENLVPISGRIVESVKEIHVNLESREDSISRMVTLENSLRRSAEQAFEDRTRSLLSAVAQSEQASISQLKVRAGFPLILLALFSSNSMDTLPGTLPQLIRKVTLSGTTAKYGASVDNGEFDFYMFVFFYSYNCEVSSPIVGCWL